MGGPEPQTPTQERNARKRQATQALGEEGRAALAAEGRMPARAKREARKMRADARAQHDGFEIPDWAQQLPAGNQPSWRAKAKAKAMAAEGGLAPDEHSGGLAPDQQEQPQAGPMLPLQGESEEEEEVQMQEQPEEEHDPGWRERWLELLML